MTVFGQPRIWNCDLEFVSISTKTDKNIFLIICIFLVAAKSTLNSIKRLDNLTFSISNQNKSFSIDLIDFFPLAFVRPREGSLWENCASFKYFCTVVTSFSTPNIDPETCFTFFLKSYPFHNFPVLQFWCSTFQELIMLDTEALISWLLRRKRQLFFDWSLTR